MSMMNAYAVDEITIVQWNGNDSWGDPESGTMVTVKGYVEWKTRLITSPRGETISTAKPSVISPVTVYLPAKIERAAYLGRGLLHEDRIILDGEDFDRAIIEIRKPKDFSHHHYEVSLA